MINYVVNNYASDALGALTNIGAYCAVGAAGAATGLGLVRLSLWVIDRLPPSRIRTFVGVPLLGLSIGTGIAVSCLLLPQLEFASFATDVIGKTVLLALPPFIGCVIFRTNKIAKGFFLILGSVMLMIPVGVLIGKLWAILPPAVRAVAGVVPIVNVIIGDYIVRNTLKQKTSRS